MFLEGWFLDLADLGMLLSHTKAPFSKLLGHPPLNFLDEFYWFQSRNGNLAPS